MLAFSVPRCQRNERCVKFETLKELLDDFMSKREELKEFEKTNYARQRESAYPTVQELVVALYDTEDKAAIEAKRAEVKKKYPKP